MYCRDSCWCVQRVSAERGAEREQPNVCNDIGRGDILLSRIWRLEIAHGVMPLLMPLIAGHIAYGYRLG